MNVIEDYDYTGDAVYEESNEDTCETVNKWLDDFGWV